MRKCAYARLNGSTLKSLTTNSSSLNLFIDYSPPKPSTHHSNCNQEKACPHDYTNTGHSIYPLLFGANKRGSNFPWESGYPVQYHGKIPNPLWHRTTMPVMVRTNYQVVIAHSGILETPHSFLVSCLQFLQKFLF